MLAILKTTALLAVGLLLALVALLIPAHVRSIDLAVIELCHEEGRAVDAILSETIRSAHIGSALRILEAADLAPAKAQAYEAQIQTLITARPSLLRAHPVHAERRQQCPAPPPAATPTQRASITQRNARRVE